MRCVVQVHHPRLEVEVGRLGQGGDAQRAEEAPADERTPVREEGAVHEGIELSPDPIEWTGDVQSLENEHLVESWFQLPLAEV